ncbi:MAG TPA: type II secretion system F family protein [Galbitalea sp.]|jgi:tight adherence protein C|nr:type II secretion system F family protein [Galbitalea sp.]
MTGLAPLAVLAGLGMGLGLWLLVSLTPRLSRPNLATRVAPYVVDVSLDARELLDRQTADPLPVFAVLFGPPVGWVRQLLGSLLGGSEPIARRLRQAGLSDSVDAFRSRQLVWAAAAAAIAVVLVLALGSIQPVPILAQVALVMVAAVGAFVGRGYLLQRAATARVARMTKELPTILEFMTLSLSAGEGILDAIRRVARISHGELAVELSVVTHDVSAGIPLVDALTRLASALQVAPLTRAIEQITGALERGTPLADVLRAQAQDARDESKRELLELSGKKEVAMLVPLVFLILPITIAIAIFPGLFVLQLGFG